MSVRPLFRTSLPPGTKRPIKGHCGLWYDKFLAWEIHAGGVTREATHKHEWVRSATNEPVGDALLLEEHTERRLALLVFLDGLAVCVKTAGRFVTGLGYEHPVENGFAWHPALGTPFLPGSGLKGVARTWATLLAATEEERGRIDRIFGPRGEGQDHAEGTVAFVEAIPRKPVQLVAEVMTPHYGPYYQSAGVDVAPGDYHDPVPIPFLAVEKGTPFLAGVLPRRRDDAGDAKQAHAWLVEALQQIGAGAKTATGYGRFVLDEESEKAWRANAARERLRTGGSLERMRQLVGQMTEGQLYQRAVQVFEKGELADPAEREAFRLATRESRFFVSWRRGRAVDPRECRAGEKKLKQLAGLIEGSR